MLLSIALPALVFLVGGVGLFWRQADVAVRNATRDEAIGLAELIATSFSLKEDVAEGTKAREAHRAVTYAVRSDWKAIRFVSSLRIIDRHGVVRWSRRVEEEDKVLADAPRLLARIGSAPSFDEVEAIPLFRNNSSGGEVLYPLGGMGCAGCHVGEASLKTGVLQLSLDEPSLRREVSRVFRGALGGVIFFSIVLALAALLALHLFLTRPLRRLALAMNKAEDGDFLSRAQVVGRDEIAGLASAFNRMLAKLTTLKAEEIERQSELAVAQGELKFKSEIERANDELKGRINELSSLYDISRTLTSTLKLSEVLQRITALVPARLQVPKFSIMLVNADGKLEVKAAHPPGHGTEGMIFEIGEGVCGQAASSKKAVYMPNLEAAPSFKIRGPMATKGRGCLLSVPMVSGGEVLGVLNLERTEKAGMSADEIEFFTTVADQVSLAVRNAHLHEQTVALSITDPLTGVPNRRHLFAQLELELARATRFGTQLSLLMIDIDYFKKLNDNAGHRAGDEVLRYVSGVFKRTIRKVDTLARYGGEEFVILLPQVTRQESLDVAEKLRRAIEEAPIEYAKVQPGGKVTISIGVSHLPNDAVEMAHLVDCADAALYASKRSGRNKVSAYASGMEMHPGRERGPFAQGRDGGNDAPAKS